MSRLLALLGRETALAWGRGGGPLVTVGFYAGAASLAPLAIGPEPGRLSAVAAGVAWVTLALAAPVAAVALGASPALAPLILVCALLGGLAFAFVGGAGAALSLGARRGGLLTAVIVLPLFAPPVIFGGGALDAYAAGLPWRAGLSLLAAYAAAAVALSPLAMAAACRNALS